MYASSSFSTEKAVCTNVVVRSAETTLAEALNLTATGSISGTVTVDGSDIENTGFLVFVAGTSYMAVTDAGGNYTISGVPAGSGYMVVAQRNGVIHSLCTDITVSAGETTQVAAADFTADELTAGLKGDAGADGKDGRDGLDGKDGVNGTNGRDGVDGTNGKDGAGIEWLGEFDSADEINEPAYLDAYFNNTDGCSYIYTKAGWVLLARAGANGAAGKDGRDGLDGKDGVNGTNGTNGKDGKNGRDGTNGKDGKDGRDGANGADGVSIVWKGELAAAPSEPEVNWAYYNTEAGCAYIWNGTKWDKLSEKGATGETGAAGKDGVNGTNGTNGKDGRDGLDGKDGTDGKDGKDGVNGADGVSIVWKGELAAAPADPQLNWAYYSTETGCAYIWNGTKWDKLSEKGATGETGAAGKDGRDGLDGKDGTNGTNGTNGKDGRDGTNGKDGKDGVNGADGVSIIWKGERFKAPAEPELNWAYYNILNGCSYIYDGNEWTLLASAGGSSTINVLPAGTDGSAGTDGIYVTLGSFPQTIKAAGVTVDETVTKTAGAYTYYKGSDGEWYAKQAEKAYSSGYKYSDGSRCSSSGTSYKYFKVEPIKWRVLTDDYRGKKLLLAETILISFAYYDYIINRTINGSTVYPNNYKESRVRAYLNGLSYEIKTSDTAEQRVSNQFLNKGFIQTAFTEEEQSCISEIEVDNSARSTNPDYDANRWNSGENKYACENTKDKIFLLSEQEVTKREYGLTSYKAPIRMPSDFAKACGTYQKTDGFGGYWWLRSPAFNYINDDGILRVDNTGKTDDREIVNDDNSSVVPALCLN